MQQTLSAMCTKRKRNQLETGSDLARLTSESFENPSDEDAEIIASSIAKIISDSKDNHGVFVFPMCVLGPNVRRCAEETDFHSKVLEAVSEKIGRVVENVSNETTIDVHANGPYGAIKADFETRISPTFEDLCIDGPNNNVRYVCGMENEWDDFLSGVETLDGDADGVRISYYDSQCPLRFPKENSFAICVTKTPIGDEPSAKRQKTL